MYDIHNSSTIFVDQALGNDKLYSGLAPGANEYGEGPYKTLTHALKIISDLRKTGALRPITIAIIGDYFTREPIVITDTMTKITIESYGKRGRIIGGARIDGWHRGSFNGHACLVAELPTENGERYSFTDLYVNGKRADTTRYPKSGTLKAVDTEERWRKYNRELLGHSKWFIARKEDIDGIEGIENATVNYYHFWIDEHSPVESFDRDSCTVTMKYPSRFALSALYDQRAWSDMYYYFSGVPSTFSEAGEWYLDRAESKVYYIPRNESEWNEGIEAFYPISDSIMNIRSSDVRIRNLELTVTTCDYASCSIVDADTKLLVRTDDVYGADGQSVSAAPGAINVEYSDRISISNCHVHSLGIHAVSVGVGCRHIRIENNLIEDVAAGGIRVYGGAAESPRDSETSDIFIIGNEIAYIGRRYEAGCGVLICHAHDNVIENNEIHHGGYSGISAGWVWGYVDSSTYGNLIRGNHIHHLGNGTLSDMGGIYLLGKQSGTVVSENRIHDITCENYGAWGIYLDEGSSFVTVEKNLVFNTKEECFDLHYGSHNVVRNNIFAATFGHFPIRNSKNELHEEVLFEKNIIVSYGSPIYNTGCGVNTFASRYNFFYDQNAKEPVMKMTESGKNIDLEKWQKEYRQDAGSVIASPCFINDKEYDFTPSDDCAAYAMGFERLPLSVTRGK